MRGWGESSHANILTESLCRIARQQLEESAVELQSEVEAFRRDTVAIEDRIAQMRREKELLKRERDLSVLSYFLISPTEMFFSLSLSVSSSFTVAMSVLKWTLQNFVTISTSPISN